MGNEKGLVVGVTVTLTLCLWVAAYLVYRELEKSPDEVGLSSSNKSQAPTTQIGNENISGNNNAQITTNITNKETTNVVHNESSLKNPRFSETVSMVSVTLGTNGANGIQARLATGLTWQWHKGNIFGGENNPAITASFVDGELCVDADIINIGNSDVFRLVGNNLQNRPITWDKNSNDTALEIVDEKGVPRFQLIYLDQRSAQIKGTFVYGNSVIFADDNGWRSAPLSEIGSVPYKCAPIFKYPSWKYPGEFIK